MATTMRFLFLLSLLLFSNFAQAQVVVPSDFMGANAGQVINTPFYSNFAARLRVWDAFDGATPHATFWSTLNMSAGVYDWTHLDGVLTAAGNKIPVTYTIGSVPAFVNSTPNLDTLARKQSLYDFVTAMMSHISGNGQCFGRFEIWNEANNGSSWWTGTDADMADISTHVYSIVKAACPSTEVLSASMAATVGANGNFPDSAFFHWYNTSALCIAGGALCYDTLNIHSYVFKVSTQTNTTGVEFVPELEANLVTNSLAIAAAIGQSGLNIGADEGFSGNAASTTVSYDTDAAAGSAAVFTLLQASGGFKFFDWFSVGTGCFVQAACGNVISTTGLLGLSRTGSALRSVTKWLAGATFTTPLARVKGANLVLTAPNAGSVAVGKLSGTGTGCPNPPVGTGAMPSRWSLSTPQTGLTSYIVGFGITGASSLPYIDIRLCGTDATAGSGTKNLTLRFDTGATASQNQTYNADVCMGLIAGTYNGATAVEPIMSATLNGSFNSDFGVISGLLPVSGDVTTQCYGFRYVVQSATSNLMQFAATLKHAYNDTTPVPIDITYRFAAPDLDLNSSQWTGIITKAGGYQATIAWDASGSGTIIAPTGTVGYRDVFGTFRSAAAGDSIALTASPVLIENKTPTVSLRIR